MKIVFDYIRGIVTRNFLSTLYKKKHHYVSFNYSEVVSDPPLMTLCVRVDLRILYFGSKYISTFDPTLHLNVHLSCGTLI